MREHLKKLRRLGVTGLLGFSSGLPLALTAGTLQAWMASSGIDIRTIGLFSAAGLPYSLKFLWAPVMDRFVPPLLGRRRGWIFITQLVLFSGIGAISLSSPAMLRALAFLSLFVAFSSASQDIVVDAYRTDILEEKERGIGAGLFVTGYRIGMLLSGAGALILAEKIGWQKTYLAMAEIMLFCTVFTILGEEPSSASPPKNLREAVKLPLLDFFRRDKSFLFLIFIILYKLCDAYAGAITTAFLIKGPGFTPSEIGVVNKGLGLLSLITGALFGGALVSRWGLFRSLLFFGVLQGISNLFFSLLAIYGRNYPLFIFTVLFENLSGGMGTSAFISLLMGICNVNYSATQYALLSSLSAVGRTLVSPTSGFLVHRIGWKAFFPVSALMAVPGIVLLFILRKEIENLRIGKERLE